MALPPTDPNPPQGPPDEPDRARYIQEVRAPGEVYQRQVVSDRALERYNTVYRVNQIIWLFFIFIEALIGLRVILRLIGANPLAPFTQIVYGASMVFLWPFSGITINPTYGPFTLELSSMIGMIVYLLIGWGVTRLIWVLFYRGSTTSESVYRQDRY